MKGHLSIWFWLYFWALALSWTFVSFHFLRNWWERRFIISLALAALPLGFIQHALARVGLLPRWWDAIGDALGLVFGVLTAVVCLQNDRFRGRVGLLSSTAAFLRRHLRWVHR